MLPGISTACLYPQETEQALRLLTDRGVIATEVFFNAFSELEPAYLKRLAAMVRESGIRVLSVHPFTSGFEPLLLFSDYRRRTLDGFELYKLYFNAANILGADKVVIHGDYRGHNHPRSFYFDVFGELMEHAGHMGVMVVQENVSRCISYTPDFFSEMAAYLPQARFVLDTKQCVRSGVRIADMMRAMGTRVCHVHISDNDEVSECLAIGRGTYDISGFLRRLRTEYGFDGGVVQELYRDSYGPLEELFDGYQLLRCCVENAKQGL